MAGGGTVTFACNGTITLAGTITNRDELILDGTGRQVTISGGNAVRIFYLVTNVNFKLVNLTLANGTSTNGAAIFNDGGVLTLSQCTFLANIATNGVLTATNGDVAGGAIYNQFGTVNAANCEFSGNGARQWSVPYQGYPPIATAPGLGGAICNRSGAVAVQDCEFIGNGASGAAGGSYSLGSTLPGGDGYGGAIYNAGLLKATRCSFSLNSARGGAGFDFGYNYTPIGSRNGSPGGAALGGAIYNLGVAMIERSLFASNSVAGGKGGRGEDGFVPMVPSGGQLFDGGNGGAGGSGMAGALFNGGTANLVNCTVAANTGSGGNGGEGGNASSLWWNGYHYWRYGGSGGGGGSGLGGVFNTNGALVWTNSTIAANRGLGGNGAPGGSGTGGGGLAGASGAGLGGLAGSGIGLINSVLSTNLPVNCSAPVTDFGHNLSSDASVALPGEGSHVGMDSRLGPLADNGGPTLTMALLPGSPAIDAGNNAASPQNDQRGWSRPFGSASDVGAYEYAMWMQPGATAGGLDLLVRDGPAGQFCRLLASTNFSDWQSVATNQISAEGTVRFTDTLGTVSAPRFYRTVVP